MNKEDILAAARNEKKGKEYEYKASLKSGLLGTLVALVVGAVLFFSEYSMKGTYNWGFLAIVFAGGCADWLYEGIKTRKVWQIIGGAVIGLVALITILAFFSQMVAA